MRGTRLLYRHHDAFYAALRGISCGCVGPERRAVFARKSAALADAREQAKSMTATPSALKKHGLAVNQDGVRRSAFDLLAYPGITVADLQRVWPELGSLPPALAERLETEALYDSYVQRQATDVAAFRRDENLRLPEELDYAQIGGLSREAQDKLARARPQTLGRRSGIPGIPGAYPHADPASTPCNQLAVLPLVRKGTTE